MNKTFKRIMIVTGEASGDLHGAKLINAVSRLSPDTTFLGVGGQMMSAAGCEILIPGEDLAVMGIVEVAGHFPIIWQSFQKLKKILAGAQRPDALVLIDFPEFNLRLARQAHKAGVPVLYYVSPQVWAWRRGRVKKIAQIVDSLAAIFPFEPELYDGLDIKVRYVGHPLLDEFDAAGERVDLRKKYQIPEQKKIVGLFPGSRRNELQFMLGTMVAAAESIYAREPEVHFMVPVAGSLAVTQIKARFPDSLPVTFVDSSNASIYDVASCCDTILSVSGTVTLQIALVGTPMVILYKVSPLTYEIGKRLIKVDHIGLANIVAGKRVVPELIQDQATPERLAAEALKLMHDQNYANSVRKELTLVRQKLGQPGCSERVAKMLLELLMRAPGRHDA